MHRPSAIKAALLALGGVLLLASQSPQPLLTGRCVQDLPLDAGEGFDHQRFLVLKDRTCLFNQDWKAPDSPWKLTGTLTPPLPEVDPGPGRMRLKWRDGALWMMRGHRILRWDPSLRQWLQRAAPSLEFMDFEVDMTGRILLVCTADPLTRTYRALLEAVEDEGRATSILAPYPDPGSMAWGRKVSPVAAATLQVGYETVQIRDFMVLFNPLVRRLFVFRPLEDRLQEVRLGLPLRHYADLVHPEPMADLCWQVLAKDATEAWLVMSRAAEPGPDSGQGGVTVLPLSLFEATAGEPQVRPGLRLPVFTGPSGQLVGLEGALSAFEGP